MNGRTSYGELLRDTTQALAVAQVRLITTTFSSRVEARRAIAAYRDAAAALATLTGRLVRTGQRFTTLPGQAADDRLRPGARVGDVLESLGKARPWTEDKAAEPLVAAWTAASSNADGSPRTRPLASRVLGPLHGGRSGCDAGPFRVVWRPVRKTMAGR